MIARLKKIPWLQNQRWLNRLYGRYLSVRKFGLVRTAKWWIGQAYSYWTYRASPTRGVHVTVMGDYGIDLRPLSASSTIFSFGVGLDISFDASLIEARGCDVHAFDPTPASIRFVEDQKASNPSIAQHFRFQPIAVAPENGTIDFHADPKGGVNHTISDLVPTALSFTAPCRTVRTLMAEAGVSHLDLIKLDIENAAVEVTDQMLSEGIMPGQVTMEVELHAPLYGTRLDKVFRYVDARNRLFERMSKSGYALIYRNGPLFTWSRLQPSRELVEAR